MQSFNHAVWSHAAHRADTALYLDRALAADPGLCLAHVMRGFGYLLLARRDLFPAARAAENAAQRSLSERGGSDREVGLTRALSLLCAGSAEAALVLLAQVSRAHTSCLFSMKTQHALSFMYGQHDAMARNAAAIVRRFDPSLPGYGFVLGCYAFVLGESGARAAAERQARGALALYPEDAWAYHALLHAVAFRSTPLDLHTLRRERAPFAACGHFQAHLAWHHGLAAIAAGALDEALALYDQELQPGLGPDFRDAVNCVSFLYRIECALGDVGQRWQRVADLAASRLDDHTLAFADAHFVLALLRAGRSDAARAFVAGMRRRAEGHDDTNAQVQRLVGIPLCERLLTSDEADSSVPPDTILNHLPRLGGSGVQRALFTLALERALPHRHVRVAARS